MNKLCLSAHLLYSNLFCLFLFIALFFCLGTLGSLASTKQPPTKDSTITFRKEFIPESIIHIKDSVYIFCGLAVCELIDVRTGRTIAKASNILHLTPDKKYAIVETRTLFDNNAALLSIESGKHIASLPKTEKYVDASSDRVLSFDSESGVATLYAITSSGFKRLVKFPIKSTDVSGFILSDGSKVVLNTRGVAIVWSGLNGARLLEVRDQKVSASPTPDRKYLVVATRARDICEFVSYDASSIAEVAKYKQGHGYCSDRGWLSNNNYYLEHYGNAFRFYALKRDAVYTHEFKHVMGYMLPALLSPSGKTAMLCDRVDTCYLVETEHGTDRYRAIKDVIDFRYANNSADSLFMIRRERLGETYKCQLLKPLSGSDIVDFGECDSQIQKHSISADGGYLVTVNGSKVNIWDDTGIKITELHQDSMVAKTHIVPLKYKAQILAVTDDKFVYVWNISIPKN